LPLLACVGGWMGESLKSILGVCARIDVDKVDTVFNASLDIPSIHKIMVGHHNIIYIYFVTDVIS
jgi:hypothetical protein